MMIYKTARSIGTKTAKNYLIHFKYFQMHKTGVKVQVYQNSVKIKEITLSAIGAWTEVTDSFVSGAFDTTIKTDRGCAFLDEFAVMLAPNLDFTGNYKITINGTNMHNAPQNVQLIEGDNAITVATAE
jgi:hypothetical protein